MDINKRTITSLHEELKNKKFSAVELLNEYIKNVDTEEPKLNVFVSELRDSALESAKKVDKKIAEGKDISLVEGIPAGLKDNFNLKGTITTASSNILKDYTSPYTATVVQRLLDKNAMFIGKTNMDAFAHGSSTETSDFGPTLNPFDIKRLAGGSSGGSAAGVAANMFTYSLGSETAGSVRGPAFWCGVYGFAPTFGRNSRYGVIAMGSSLDRPGVFGNSVKDCALVSDVMSGQDSKDATSIPEAPTNYANNLSDKNKKITIGIPKQFLDDRIDSQVSASVMKSMKEYEKLGATLVEIDLMDPKYSIAVYTIICRSEVSSNLARIDGIRYGHNSDKQAESVLDSIANNRGEGFGNEAKQRSLTGAYALSAGYYDAYYKKAMRVRSLIIDDFTQAFKKVDLIMGPTMPTLPPKIGITDNNPLFGELADMLTEPSAFAGLPCISVPTELSKEGLPLGFQIFGPQFKEQEVLDAAYVYEKNVFSLSEQK